MTADSRPDFPDSGTGSQEQVLVDDIFRGFHPEMPRQFGQEEDLLPRPRAPAVWYRSPPSATTASRNPNVIYELGLAYALKKPVVLVPSNEGDVPFDLRHIRVIIYDTTDPFWGNKLLEIVAENILSVIDDPESQFQNPGSLDASLPSSGAG